MLAAATGTRWGDPHIVDETLEPLDFDAIAPGDVVGIGIHTGNALRGYEIGRQARQRGAWVMFGGTRAGLEDVYKGFNLARDETQFVLLTPFPGTVDFEKWAAEEARRPATVDGIPVTQHWLIPEARRPRLYSPHPTMTLEQIRVGTQHAWDRFYSFRQIWERSRVVESIRAPLAFVLISKLYRQMYANTGIATDSARVQRSARWARWMAKACRRFFVADPIAEVAA